MTTATSSPTAPIPPALEAPLYRISPAQYLAMAEAGILGDDARVELLEGLIVEKVTHNPPHMVACSLLLRHLTRALPAGWFLAMQGPVETPDSLPEQDAVLVRGAERDYLGRRWGAADVGLIVEVSDSSLGSDCGTKKRIYARAGVRVYWIVNLVDRQIEVFTAPSGPAAAPEYGREEVFLPGQRLPLVLDGAPAGEIAVADLLP